MGDFSKPLRLHCERYLFSFLRLCHNNKSKLNIVLAMQPDLDRECVDGCQYFRFASFALLPLSAIFFSNARQSRTKLPNRCRVHGH